MTLSNQLEQDSARTEADVLELTIVLPCLNEAETLEICVRKATQSLERLGVKGEVVVADNGSTDGSQDIARANGARVVDVPRRGYGAALMAGIEAADGKYVLMADADDSYALDDIEGFLVELRKGADLVMGNRFQGGIAPGAMPFLHRYLGNPVLSKLGKVFFRIPVGDFHCGIRAFRRDRMLELGLRTSGMEFASEMVVRSALNHRKIAEVPTTLRPDGRSRAPHLRTWRDGWRHLRFLLAFSPRWLLYYPSAAFSLIGLVGLLWLSFGPQQVGGIGFGLQSMLAFATMFILGLQGTGLAVVARSYAAHLGLLPPPSGRMMERVAKASLERGVWIGSLLILLGIASFIVAILTWGATGFGALDVVETMRIPILGMVCIVSGFQMISVSFTLSLTKIGED
ncbi:glycosyltransferase family 2 protein [Kibdelosporangium philippinense]|uniref:Glycosyltransferase family 2 protein n=1 Tax=Kibdelosporangium philippinense TaxID=211113 RepID=A0ABS8ZQF8_9PSEU|nr:glycosyltransferase family 2 protein [Kibdelosporangium philippinense]MCE7008861.1 glycosyltransferase family 2 protein [Kibdelosporangium philippinense]